MPPEEAKLVEVIASNAKRLRKARGLTQSDMAKHGFDCRSYQRLESGKYTPTLGSLIKLAKAFKVKVPDLMK